MKIVFVNLPAHGHINPTLPLVQALVAEGHQVTYFSMPEFEKKIKTAGAVFISYTGGIFDYNYHSPPSNPFQLVADLTMISLEVLPGLITDVRELNPDLIIHDSVTPWGKYLASIINLPVIGTVPTFAFNQTMMKGQLSKWDYLQSLLASGFSRLRSYHYMSKLKKSYGLTDLDHFDVLVNREPLNLVFTSREFQPDVDTFDEDYHFIGPMINPELNTGSDSLEVVEKVKAHQGKVLYISLGTVMNDNPEFFNRCFEAFSDEALLVVMSLGDKVKRNHLRKIPANFITDSRIPQQALLPHVDTFLTHCGMNSSSEGLYNGIPLLLAPQTMEQSMVANRVHKLGAGILVGKNPSVNSLKDGVKHILAEPGFKAKAQSLGDSLHQNTPLKKIVKMVNEHSL